MLKLIMGKQGSGKTKQILEMVRNAIDNENGNVVCIETKKKLACDIHHGARLIEADAYPIAGYNELLSFICGMCAANFDITHIFIDSLYKVAKSNDTSIVEDFLGDLYDFTSAHDVNVTITISADPSEATDGMRAFF